VYESSAVSEVLNRVSQTAKFVGSVREVTELVIPWSLALNKKTPTSNCSWVQKVKSTNTPCRL